MLAQLSGSLLHSLHHLHRGRGGGEGLDLAWLPPASSQRQRGWGGPGPGLTSATRSTLISSSQQVGTLPPASQGSSVRLPDPQSPCSLVKTLRMW